MRCGKDLKDGGKDQIWVDFGIGNVKNQENRLLSGAREKELGHVDSLILAQRNC